MDLCGWVRVLVLGAGVALVLATTFSAPGRSSAARAALRSTRLLLHLFRANFVWGSGARPLGAHLYIVAAEKGGRMPWHRRYWPETDVGAALCCEAPRGRRSI